MAQATVYRYPKGMQFLDSTGKPLAGGCLWYFMAGTMTPQSVYLDSGGATVFSSGSVNGIPYIQLDSAGRLTNPVYLGPVAAYKEYLTDATGSASGIVGANTISPWPEDNIPAAPTSSVTQQIPTGTPLPYLGTVSPSGFVLAFGTIGNPSSGASNRANSDTQALFVLLWNADTTNTYFVISGGRGASALVDFNANKAITLPDLRGRTIIGLDNMGGSPAGRLLGLASGAIAHPTTLGATGGEEAHLLAVGEESPHGHGVGQWTFTPQTPNVPLPNVGAGAGGTSEGWTGTTQTLSANQMTTAITINNATGGAAHNNLPPAMLMNWIVKL